MSAPASVTPGQPSAVAMPQLAYIAEDGELHHFAMLGIHNLEHLLSRHAAFHEWLNERGLQMTPYHDRLEAGEFLPGSQPHYAEGENPSPVAESEAPAQPEQPMPEPLPDEAQPQPEAPAEGEEVVVEEETVVEEAPAEEAPPA